MVLNVNAVLFPVTFVAFHTQPVGVFMDLSVNTTVKGAVPLVLSEVKLATGAGVGAETLINVT